MSLKRRQYKNASQQPVAYPAWRVWEDRRVRLDDAVLALFVAVRVARIGISDRAPGGDASLVSELYTDEELDFRLAFQVTAPTLNGVGNKASRSWPDRQFCSASR